MDKNAIITEALGAVFSGIDKLKQAFPGRLFTIDGRLVGDIGEVIAAMNYEIELYKVQRPDHDGETPEGKKVQVKATFKDSLSFKTVPDYYLGLKLFKNGSYEEIFNGPGSIIYERYKSRAGIGKTLLSFPIKELKKLSEDIKGSERIKKR